MQPQAKVVLRQEDGCDAGMDIGFVPRQPAQLRRSEAGHRQDPGHLAALRGECQHLVAFGGGAGIVPQDRGAEGVVPRI